MSSASSIPMLREEALALFRIGVASADPQPAVQSALRARLSALDAAKRIVVLAVGKAAIPMTQAAMPFVEHRLAAAVAVTNRENARPVPRVTVIVGGHPLPDRGSVEGARHVEELARNAGEGDLVLVLLSGGGSALLCAPVDGLSLEDKIALNEALIHSGADIADINRVRSAVSRLKGGGLAQIAASASVMALILSDVPGDDLATIASGPTVTPTLTLAERQRQARAILARHGIASLLPQVDSVLRQSRPGDERAVDRSPVENVLIGSNALSVRSMLTAARARNWDVVQPSEWLDGDVAEAARRLCSLAREVETGKAMAVICGGETTVRVRGKGLGGRNQELALRFALLAQKGMPRRPWAFLSGGTDGRDGPTDAAGGLVDPETIERLRGIGLEAEALVADNDSYRALEAAGDLVRIKATGTNVADLQVLLLG